jgi:predicted phage terminase large subunit-like protein
MQYGKISDRIAYLDSRRKKIRAIPLYSPKTAPTIVDPDDYEQLGGFDWESALRAKFRVGTDNVIYGTGLKEDRRGRPQPYERLPVEVDEVALIRAICKESFFEFVKEFWSTVVAEDPVWNWHIEYLCDECQVLCERIFKGEPKAYDLLVNIAPGTTKSMIMSIMLPAWCFTRMPSFRFIGASYSYPLAMDLSTKCRDIVESEKYKECFPYVEIREDQNTKGYFKTSQKGFRYAVGVNGAITGVHSHLTVIDDPLNPQQAQSEKDINSANHWIKHTLSSRKVNKSVSVMALVMQRLHQNDASADFLHGRKGKVRHICLPAEIDPSEPSNVRPPEAEKFYKDGLMDPIRMSATVLKEERAKGEFYYSSQFRQEPVPAGGGMFKIKKIKSAICPNIFKRVIRFWDKAGSLKAGCYTAGVKMGLDKEDRYWILDVVRFQLDSFEREKMIEAVAISDGYNVQIGMEVEPGSGGKESAQASVRNLAGFSVTVVKADKTTGGKQFRADPFAAQMNSGNVYISSDMVDPHTQSWIADSWVTDLVEELKYFPNSKYKDQVDACSGAFSMCHKKRVRVGSFRNEIDVATIVIKPTSFNGRKTDVKSAIGSFYKNKLKIGGKALAS